MDGIPQKVPKAGTPGTNLKTNPLISVSNYPERMMSNCFCARWAGVEWKQTGKKFSYFWFIEDRIRKRQITDLYKCLLSKCNLNLMFFQ